KARSASKIRSKAAGSGQPKGQANSKQARVLALLCGPSGATIATVTRSTGWQPHTVRAFLAAVVRKKLELRLESETTSAERVYRFVARTAPGDDPSAARAWLCGADGSPGRDRGRDCSFALACLCRARATLAGDLRTNPASSSEQRPLGANDRL